MPTKSCRVQREFVPGRDFNRKRRALASAEFRFHVVKPKSTSGCWIFCTHTEAQFSVPRRSPVSSEALLQR